MEIIFLKKLKKTLYKKKEEYADFVLYIIKKLKLLTLCKVSTIERKGTGNLKPSWTKISLLNPKFITKLGKRNFFTFLFSLEKFSDRKPDFFNLLKLVIVPGIHL